MIKYAKITVNKISGNTTIGFKEYNNASQLSSGLMSSTDKTKLDKLITYGTTDLVDGVSPLATGVLYVVYEE